MGYLYRAVDKQGRTLESLFPISGGIASAMAFFLARRWQLARHAGRARLRWMGTSRVIGHCAGFAGTLAGIEFAQRIRERQLKFGPGRWIYWSLKTQWDTALS